MTLVHLVAKIPTGFFNNLAYFGMGASLTWGLLEGRCWGGW